MSRLFAVHGLNRFLWSKLVADGVMDPSRFVDKVGTQWIPIVPTQMITQFIDMQDTDGEGGVPFIVYNWNVSDISQAWYLQSDQIAYLIYSTDEGELRDITKYIVDLFKKYDGSAEPVNDFIHSHDDVAWDVYKAFDYKSISLTTSASPLPADEQGGRLQSSVVIKATYTEL